MRCAAWARAEAVDPIGTAGRHSGFLLVEWPQPWPSDLAQIPELAPLHDALRGSDIRLQAIVGHTVDRDRRRVVFHRRRRDDGWFREMHGVERSAPLARLVRTALAVIASGDGDDVTARDVLICAHGRRDVCCGSRGTVLAGEAVERLGGEVRVWRTSHTGGHRFAPTAIVLPEATMWAFLDAEALERIVRRRGPLEDLLSRYRGCAGLPTAEAQALDRVGFGDIGWAWLRHARRARASDGVRVRLDALTPDGPTLSWDAVVDRGRCLPVPVCGESPDRAEKSESELVVRDLVRRTTVGRR